MSVAQLGFRNRRQTDFITLVLYFIVNWLYYYCISHNIKRITKVNTKFDGPMFKKDL